MRHTKKLLLPFLLLCLAATSAAAAESSRKAFPAPDTVSTKLRELIAADPPSYWNRHPKTALEWKTFVKELADATAPMLSALRERTGVTSTSGTMGGVPVYIITPKNLPAEDADRVLLNFHGGGYVLGPGESGAMEAMLMAGIGGYRVIMPDYRMVPDHPYPAAMDDAIAVYKELLKTIPAERIGVFGTSTGGGMTLAVVLRAKAEGLPLPAAIAAGTPWTDLSKTGDSYFTNEHVDNILMSYDGWLGEAAKIYAAGHDLKDPMLSPIYGDVSGFPPTMLTSGTRDLFLSNTVRMHLKLRQAGVIADLIVFEGMSHAQYHMLPDAPETKFHFTELGKFFNRYMQ
jgi:acetyl esterase/lipase